jgi:SLOG in TRPM
VTGGTRAGVMEIVGETILDYMLQTGGTEKRITALGIASWGFVGNRSALVSPDVRNSIR